VAPKIEQPATFSSSRFNLLCILHMEWYNKSDYSVDISASVLVALCMFATNQAWLCELPVEPTLALPHLRMIH
jgi:hypothetical protein